VWLEELDMDNGDRDRTWLEALYDTGDEEQDDTQDHVCVIEAAVSAVEDQHVVEEKDDEKE
jgi:hypothetical protein